MPCVDKLLNGRSYTRTTAVSYDSLNRITGFSDNGVTSGYTYHLLGMTASASLSRGNTLIQYAYTYETAEESPVEDVPMQTGRLESVTSTLKQGSTTRESNTFAYTYDDHDNITEIRIDGVLKYSYEYDHLDQLIRENNVVAGKTYLYTYDNAGNITSKKTYPYTTGAVGSMYESYYYSYSSTVWGDQLTRYGGYSLTYDALGNPISYSNGNVYTLSWEKGRQLKSVSGSSYNIEATSYEYNADGIRTKKIKSSSTIEYVLDGDRIIAEYHSSNGTLLRYLYDANGAPIGMIYNGSTYLYEKNLQGDVIGIYDSTGTRVVSYTYDAWGNTVSYSTSNTSIWFYNPFRYRGYYYDTETGFYYLNSRYYDPAIGRFINADGYVNANGDLIGYNMYAYCSNNPVNMIDPMGTDAVAIVLYDLDKGGLPIFGHIQLYYQTEDGVWWFTEYASKNWNPFAAKVTTHKTSADIRSILSLPQSKDTIEYVYLYGDYSWCHKLAQEWNGSDLDGYNLLSNNCLHYVSFLLLYGSPNYSHVTDYLLRDKNVFTPSNFIKNLKIAASRDFWEPGGHFQNYYPKQYSAFVEMSQKISKFIQNIIEIFL